MSHKVVEASLRHLFIGAWTREEEDPGNKETFGCGVLGKGGVGAGSPEKCVTDPNDVYQLSLYIFTLGVIRKFKMNNVL